jgi:hypothetical protein
MSDESTDPAGGTTPPLAVPPVPPAIPLAPTGGAQKEKVKGIVDIVFLLDATGSMKACIDAVKDNIETFIVALCAKDANNESVIKDWRAKIVGYRDYLYDPSRGRAAFINNPFVTTAEELKDQLDALKAEGGGDEPESLFDALFDVIKIGSTEKGGTPDPTKWRYRSDAARCVIVFTDAPPHKTMAASGREGGVVEDVINVLHAEKIILTIFAPEIPADDNWGSYYDLDKADKAQYKVIDTAGDDIKSRQQALADFTKDGANFRETMEQLAKTVSQSQPPDEL